MPESTHFGHLERVALDTQIVGRPIVAFDVIDSTNTYALDKGTDGMVIVADSQSAGRGRKGRKWHSASGLGLWFTIALEGAPEGLTFAAALAVRRALSDRCDLRIKWPNDLLLNGKKVCGILTEHRENVTAVGIGLNVSHHKEDFPEELQDKASSLNAEVRGSWERSEILLAILTHFDEKVILLRRGGYEAVRSDWAEACNLIGRRVSNGDVSGEVTDIDGLGALIVDTPSGPERILSGEITVLDGD